MIAGLHIKLPFICKAYLSDYNNTTPDTIDLTGKTVQTVKHGKHGEEQEAND